MLLIESGPAFLLFECVLDPARVRQGHAVQLVDATRIGLYRQGDVDEALDGDHGNVAQADALDVLGLPTTLELDAILVDADDSVVVPRSLRYGRCFQAVLHAVRVSPLTPGYKTPYLMLGRRQKHRPEKLLRPVPIPC